MLVTSGGAGCREIVLFVGEIVLILLYMNRVGDARDGNVWSLWFWNFIFSFEGVPLYILVGVGVDVYKKFVLVLLIVEVNVAVDVLVGVLVGVFVKVGVGDNVGDISLLVKVGF